MKKGILAAVLLSAGLISYGQCEKRVLLTASKTEHLGADSSVQRTDDETTVIEFDKSNISITPSGHTMTGTIKSYTCDWPTPFKVGKTRMKVTLANEAGETKDATITIEGKNGKINFLAELDEDPDKKIRLQIEKFEEKH